MNEILNSVCAANFTFCHRVVINLLTNYFQDQAEFFKVNNE